jgi:hypothetical protein
VIRDGLRALLARDRAVESWLHNQVGPAYDALKADPSRAVTVDQVRARLAVEHAKGTMIYRVIFTPEAEKQLAALYGYIAVARRTI